MTKGILLLCAFTMLFIVQPFQVLGNSYSETEITQQRERLLQAYITNKMGHEYAANYFVSTEIFNTLHQSFPTTRDGSVLYPNNIGGFYINDDGLLVILQVESAASLMETMRLPRNGGFIIREVQNSYNELRAANNVLMALIPRFVDLPAVGNVDGWTLDVINNQIVVHLVEYSEYKIRLFAETIIDSELIVFEPSSGRPQFLPSESFSTYPKPFVLPSQLPLGFLEVDASEVPYLIPHLIPPQEETFSTRSAPRIRAGQRIYVQRPGSWNMFRGSAGYRARAFGVNGFMTAYRLGGGLRSGDVVSIVGFDGRLQRIGQVHDTRRDFHDAAFVELDNGVVFGPVAQPRWETQLVGRWVISEGGASAIRLGQITGAWNGWIGPVSSGHIFVAAYRANYFSADEDSGGIVYGWQWNAVHGITVGIDFATGDSLFICARNINNAFGAVLH